MITNCLFCFVNLWVYVGCLDQSTDERFDNAHPKVIRNLYMVKTGKEEPQEDLVEQEH